MSKRSDTNGRVIVAGYDGSATAKAAVDYAAREAGPDGYVLVVHAYGDHLEHGRAVIDGLALEDDPLLETEWEAELIEGPPAEAILDVAHARHADQIVVGSRGRGRLARAALGSVSHELLNRSDVPVVIIPHIPDDASS
jgi:nucleotide-binding universal stress UspA family protein